MISAHIDIKNNTFIFSFSVFGFGFDKNAVLRRAE